ncbi:Gmad2 immunoglobulin-like domain-containing protein [Nocardioides stalactiti]|uniref:Gmad2 immunoglobulin-like domain-containing protein n=1 Tax=Nocardioides stalactiti TaxID=2755356 RepID=UPI0016020826|nr:Gmad2 immunoglobulin-like domain-containing protein [Nocardioides stalactiti]
MKRHSLPPQARLATTAALAALLLAGCGDDEPTSSSGDDPASTPAAETSDATEPTDPGSTDSAEPTESDTAPASTIEVPVFFVADTPAGQGLVAEVRAVGDDNPLEEAAALVTAGDVLDPDYRTLFPSGSFASVTFDGEQFVVTLADDSWNTRPAGMSAADAELAVQQLVYTLQAVQGEEAPVAVQPSGRLLGIEAASVDAADELEVRSFVNVLSPAEGATVSDTFTASGEASSFEATVPWQVRDSSGAKVLEGFATAEGWIDGLYPWETEVDVSSLAPGEYTFVALTDDPSGGAEGNGPSEDTKTIVVE